MDCNEVKQFFKFATEILMIQPTHFGTNFETLDDNAFMKENVYSDVQERVLNEFNNFVSNLKNREVDVLVFKQPEEKAKDAIFPNNWFSTHKNINIPEGLLIIYPMKSPNRRLERNTEIIELLKSRYKYFLDLTYLENEGHYLESTGSLIFDNLNRKIYCSISERASEYALSVFLERFNSYSKNPYELIIFNATDGKGNKIYHTNVVMSVLDKHIVVCLDSIKDNEEKTYIMQSINSCENKKLLEISYKEMENFACNVINIKSKNTLAKTILVISETAYKNLGQNIIKELEEEYDVCVNNIETIEQVGGGSCRCMVGEIF